jgi:hypothetical protein
VVTIVVQRGGQQREARVVRLQARGLQVRLQGQSRAQGLVDVHTAAFFVARYVCLVVAAIATLQQRRRSRIRIRRLVRGNRMGEARQARKLCLACVGAGRHVASFVAAHRGACIAATGRHMYRLNTAERLGMRCVQVHIITGRCCTCGVPFVLLLLLIVVVRMFVVLLLLVLLFVRLEMYTGSLLLLLLLLLLLSHRHKLRDLIAES